MNSNNEKTNNSEITSSKTPSSSGSQDRLYLSPFSSIPAFSFDEQVTEVFADMIRRSVPGYGTLLELTPSLISEYLQPNTCIYDIGCSLGASFQALQYQLPKLGHQLSDYHWVGIDNSPPMIEQAKALNQHCNVDWRCEDIRDSDIQNASCVLLNYCCQFIPITERNTLIAKIFHSLKPGGILLLSEKVLLKPIERNSIFEQWHTQFKLTQNYSALEVARKKEALETVLIRETQQQHFERLITAGFSRPETVMSCLNFHSYLAIKPLALQSKREQNV